MSYLLLRVADGWITNNDGDFYVEDTGKYLWIKLCKILILFIYFRAKMQNVGSK